MADNSNNDLASILRTLSESNQRASNQPGHASESINQYQHTSQDRNDLSSLVSLLSQNQRNHPGPLQKTDPGRGNLTTYQAGNEDTNWNRPVSARPAPSSTTKPELPDASNITEWASGLRHVSKLAATNEAFEATIRKMIKNQNDNEKQWFTGRQALVQQQKDRVDNKRKLDDVLSSVGGKISNEPEIHDNDAEIRRYDEKVHRAMTRMTSTMSAELSKLNVPFFCTKAELLLEKPIVDDNNSSQSGFAQKLITHDQLGCLQHKMLDYLLDMYGD